MTDCCPPGSAPYLAATYEAKGTVEDLGAVSAYFAPVSGSPTKAILMCPDVWGWNGGRIRAWADSLAEKGYLVAVPKLLVPAKDGGTDGDALAPTTEFDLEWVKQFPYSTQKPKMDATLDALRKKGATKIGVLGFCYGGHPACWASSEHADIAAGAIFHPSMQLEQFAYGGDVGALMKSVRCPFLISPAGNDVPTWAEDSPFLSALKSSACASACEFKLYPDMVHGWTLRGDIANAAVARDVGLAFDAAVAFFGKHM